MRAIIRLWCSSPARAFGLMRLVMLIGEVVGFPIASVQIFSAREFEAMRAILYFEFGNISNALLDFSAAMMRTQQKKANAITYCVLLF